ncbi:MAG: hypothetical protein AAGB31_11155 [Bdellovibrio sp.]
MTKWKLKPVSLFKQMAAATSVVSMCLAPVAQGASVANEKKVINQYLKDTGIATKKMTVGDFWKKVRHTYPAKMRSQMDLWVSHHRNEMMPKVEASSFKDAKGVEQVRLVISQSGGQSITVTFTGDETKPLKINSATLTEEELAQDDLNKLARLLVERDPAIAKMTQKKIPVLSKTPVMSAQEYSKLTARQKAEYLIRLRLAMEAAQKVFKAKYGAQALQDLNRKYEWVYQVFFGEEAQAAGLEGKPCIIAGYLSIYGKNSCGGAEAGRKRLESDMELSGANCAPKEVSCNPMVYGYRNDGNTYCVASSQVKFATENCNKQSPLRTGSPQETAENKKRIIESFLKRKGFDKQLKLAEDPNETDPNKKIKMSRENLTDSDLQMISSYLGELQNYINTAIHECNSGELKQIREKVLKKDATRGVSDQTSACNEIETRAFDLQSFAANPLPAEEIKTPPPVVPVQVGGEDNCGIDKPGSEKNEAGSCTCKAGTKEEGGQCLVIAAGGTGDLPPAQEKPKPVKEKKDDDSSWGIGGWLAALGIGALVGWGLYNLFKSDSKSKKPVYVPPAPVPGATITPTVTPTTTPSTCISPSVWNGVICLAPAAPTTEGGTTQDSGVRAGGAR